MFLESCIRLLTRRTLRLLAAARTHTSGLLSCGHVALQSTSAPRRLCRYAATRRNSLQSWSASRPAATSHVVRTFPLRRKCKLQLCSRHRSAFMRTCMLPTSQLSRPADLPADLTIPPPRPKRKPARPYPKKSEPEVSGGNGGVGNGALGSSDNGFGSAPMATRLHSHHQHGHHHGHHGLQQRQHITGSVALQAPNRPPLTPSPSPGPQSMVSAPAMMGGMPAPYLQHGGPVWGHHGAHHSGVDAGVAAVAAAASAAAAAAAAAVVATADEATQAQLQV